MRLTIETHFKLGDIVCAKIDDSQTKFMVTQYVIDNTGIMYDCKSLEGSKLFYPFEIELHENVHCR